MIQRALLVDDEPLALKLLNNRLKDIPTIQVVGETTKGSEVLHLIKECQPHIVFLDINLGTYSGLDLAEQIYMLYPNVQVVFVTAYSEYAIQAFELNAIDYLLKPVTASRLTKTISRLTPKNNDTLPIVNRPIDILEKQLESVHLKVFGHAQFLDSSLQPIKVRTKKVEELFYFLWHTKEEPPTRDTILDSLWGDLSEEKAAALMHSTFYQLRKTLHQLHFENPILLQNKVYHLNLDVQTDFEEWQTIIENNRTDETSVLRALDLYRGDYFAVQAFEWAQTKCEKIRTIWTHYLLRVMQERLISTSTLEMILIHIENLEIFHEDWIVETIHFLGESNQFQNLARYYSKVQSSWKNELGISIPRTISDLYSHYLMLNK